MSKKNLIKRNDYDRVLITETLPYETPIIFSNNGLYDRIKNINIFSLFEQKIIKELVLCNGGYIKSKPTKPYLYKIRKNALEYRRLALLHPASQWKIREFYNEYDKLILYYCSENPASIRAPKKIASSFYSKGSWENIYKYKTGSVTSDTIDGYAKHTPSFFTYKGYDRLYKFFNSSDYFNLEKKFKIQMSLDVSKCFDSIYTHSMAWATKEKEFVKNNLNVSSFGEDFDFTIRHGNYNETNGIPIGPEVSRIFSEIIFQRIDGIVIGYLKNQDLIFDVEYTFRRYVDDVYIFAKDEDVARKIYSIYADTLMKFNLHTNSSKLSIQYRPFVSKKSRLIHGASSLANIFFDTCFMKNDFGQLKPKNIHSPWKVAKTFIDSIKNLCNSNEVDYDEISSFIISSITERIKRLINVEEEIIAEEVKSYFHVIKTLLEVSFFLYSVAPSVSSSYKLSTIIILLVRFTNIRLKVHQDEVCHKIYELTSQLLLDESQSQGTNPIEGFVHLEFINILIATRELGDEYLIPESVIEGIFPKMKDLSYFSVTSCLFYIKNAEGFDNIRNNLNAYLNKKFEDLSDIATCSEKLHLLLDVLSCPYIPIKFRKKWLKALGRRIGVPTMSPVEINNNLDSLTKGYWQINWSDVDLLNSLEKKELKRAY
ncbi:antiviral reverse transcriptase Drt3b [Acinetobacter dispersus]|uniref:antiviral reverse transcriptase Drt3b n=1 Tax=Acinetobacter dispersus TaxID=70348 RepID=UPI00132EB787|nr:antiviral reverse transcriptase Drt3b [Acinetobacter dispersus]QHH96056.1 RNA-directed DNA polymerase [Acinetobacter dispersus]